MDEFSEIEVTTCKRAHLKAIYLLTNLYAGLKLHLLLLIQSHEVKFSNRHKKENHLCHKNNCVERKMSKKIDS